MVISNSPGGVLVRIAGRGEGRPGIGGHGVLGRLEVAVLDPGVRLAACVVAVAGNAAKVVVVEMGILQVVGAGIALVGSVEVVVVDGALGDDVIRPA